jgi:hypothetical protein
VTLCRHLATERPETALLLMSGLADTMNIGSWPCLQNPFTPAVLLLNIRQLLNMQERLLQARQAAGAWSSPVMAIGGNHVPCKEVESLKLAYLAALEAEERAIRQRTKLSPGSEFSPASDGNSAAQLRQESVRARREVFQARQEYWEYLNQHGCSGTERKRAWRIPARL